jgi:hypothetical protein
MPWTLDAALDHDLIEVVERNHAWGLYRFRLRGLSTVISVKLCRSPINEETRFERSHDIHTPSQAGPYGSSRLFWDDPAYALHNAVNGITMYYEMAVQDGHTPSDKWFVANDFTEV